MALPLERSTDVSVAIGSTNGRESVKIHSSLLSGWKYTSRTSSRATSAVLLTHWVGARHRGIRRHFPPFSIRFHKDKQTLNEMRAQEICDNKRPFSDRWWCWTRVGKQTSRKRWILPSISFFRWRSQKIGRISTFFQLHVLHLHSEDQQIEISCPFLPTNRPNRPANSKSRTNVSLPSDLKCCQFAFYLNTCITSHAC